MPILPVFFFHHETAHIFMFTGSAETSEFAIIPKGNVCIPSTQTLFLASSSIASGCFMVIRLIPFWLSLGFYFYGFGVTISIFAERRKESIIQVHRRDIQFHTWSSKDNHSTNTRSYIFKNIYIFIFQMKNPQQLEKKKRNRLTKTF